MQVLYFASAREFIGNIDKETYTLSEGILTLSDLVKEIRSKHADKTNFLAVLERSMIALNEEYVYELGKATLKANDEVAVIPPISGG